MAAEERKEIPSARASHGADDEVDRQALEDSVKHGQNCRCVVCRMADAEIRAGGAVCW